MGEKSIEKHDFQDWWRTALILAGKCHKHTKWEEIYHVDTDILCECDGLFFGIVRIDTHDVGTVYIVLENMKKNFDYHTNKNQSFKYYYDIFSATRYLASKYIN